MPPGQNIEVAVTLTAYNKMAGVMMKAQQQIRAVSEAALHYGRNSVVTGAAIAAPIIAGAKMYASQENAMLQMKAELLQDGNRLNLQQYNSLINFAKKSTEVYGGTAEDYMKMIRVLRENSINPNEILGGVGASVEKLALFFQMPPDAIAQFAARMRQDMGILPKEMTGMMDLVARLKNAGVGKTGEEAVNEMSEAYAKAGLGAHNLGVQGLQASKDLGALMGIFIRRGMSGGTVGNNFRRIFDGLRSAEKLKKANDIARQYGITLDFYTKDHKFKGIASFTAELNKLKGLNSTQISAILNPFSGKQGLSTDFLEFLGKEGTSAFNDFQAKLASQATLDEKVRVIQSGLSFQIEQTMHMAINAAAAIGKTYGPQIKMLLQTFRDTTMVVINFVNHHEKLIGTVAKFLLYFAGYKTIVGFGAIVWGSFLKGVLDGLKIFNMVWKGLRNLNFILGMFRTVLVESVWPALVSASSAVWAFTAALLANPITWVIAGVVALAASAYLIYKNWDPIMTWFSEQWTIAKAQISGVLEVAKLLANITFGSGSIMDLLDIGKVYSSGYNASMGASAAVARQSAVSVPNSYSTRRAELKPTRNAATAIFQPSVTINLHGGATKEHGEMIGKTVKEQFGKLMKEHLHDQKRRAY